LSYFNVKDDCSFAHDVVAKIDGRTDVKIMSNGS